jgi:hypothetical protein
MTPARGQFILALIVLAAPLAAWGQVRIAQDGRALDANPYVGGGGYNPVYPGTGLLDSQLFVNRQVTGLAGFRGSVGYYPVDQLNLALPGDSLEAFRQQSVGTQDVLRGQTYMASPYYDSIRTIVDLRSIAAGQVTPGRTVPQAMPPPTGLFGQTGTLAYAPLALTQVTDVAGFRVSAAEGSFLRFDTGQAVAPDRTGSGYLFAVPDTAQREQLARELNQVELPADLMVQSEVNARVDPSVAAERRRRLSLPTWENEPNEPNAAGQRVPLQQPPYLRRPTPTAPDQDVFSDMLLLQMQGGTIGMIPRQMPPAGPSEQAAPEAPPASAAERIQAGHPQLRAPLVELESGPPPLLPTGGTLAGTSLRGRLVVHGLAGTGHDEFNVVMTAAGESLKAGRAYEAGESYRQAAALQPDNPLPRLGMSLALFEAGESLGAAQQLHRAAQLYPPILTSQVDLEGMVDRDLLIRRLDFLAARLASTATGNEPMLYFIAAFVHANLGQETQARQYARKLQASAPADVVLGNYARFVLTGQTTSAPTSRPTSQPSTAQAAR